MEKRVTAGIDILGPALRYAEVEQVQRHYRLLRLGSCSFDFDVVGELLHRDTPKHLSVVAEALQDVLRGASSRHLRVAIHPHDVYAFTTPLPAELDAQARQDRLEQEAALVVGQPAAAQLEVSAQATRPVAPPDSGDPVEWTQALALPHAVRGRVERVLRHLPHHSHEWMLSTEGAARIAHWVETHGDAPDPSAPFSLAVGWYTTHAEYVVLHNGAWYYGHYAATESPTDCAYFAAVLLNRLDVSVPEVGRIYLYGEGIDTTDFASLRAVFGAPLEVLDPLPLVGVSPDKLDNHFEPESYAPCIGVTL